MSRKSEIMNAETKQFIIENLNAEVLRLALQSGRFPLVDMPLAIRQIAGKQKIKSKVPLFYNTPDILFPIQLSLEQSSSESTAKYKSGLCEGNILVDLTGGFGVDCCFMSEHFQQVSYVERQPELCELARHNFKLLKKNHVQIIQSETEKYLSEMDRVDWIFIDPARRSSTGKKMVFLSDCEPDVSALSTQLLEKAKRVMIKLSPMMDISTAINDLPTTAEIHIISVENECKEVLLILEQNPPENIRVITINLGKNNEIQRFVYNLNEESASEVICTSKMNKYLYEPNSSVMKSGAFKLIANHFSVNKLHTNTHLYTSTKLLLEFPGRIFEVVKLWGNSKQELKELLLIHPKANISTRNYPLSVDELRKKLKIKDGGETYLFACTLANERKVIIECKKILNI